MKKSMLLSNDTSCISSAPELLFAPTYAHCYSRRRPFHWFRNAFKLNEIERQDVNGFFPAALVCTFRVTFYIQRHLFTIQAYKYAINTRITAIAIALRWVPLDTRYCLDCWIKEIYGEIVENGNLWYDELYGIMDCCCLVNNTPSTL